MLSLERFLRRNLRPILDGLSAGRVTVKEAAKSLGGLESAMDDAGLKGFFDEARSLFVEEYDRVQDEFEQTTGKKALLSQFTRGNLDALVDARLDQAARVVKTYLGDVRVAVLDSVVGGRKFKPEDVLDRAEGRGFHDVATEVNTSLMAFQRVVHLEKAKKAGVDKFLYIGPLDKVTRPFCRQRVGRVFSLAQVQGMDNEQGLPVEIYCGGFNCRHHWRPVSDELARELESGDRGQE